MANELHEGMDSRRKWKKLLVCLAKEFPFLALSLILLSASTSRALERRLVEVETLPYG